MKQNINEDMRDAIERLGATRDGFWLRMFLQKTMMSLAPGNCESGALFRHEGRRTLAADLKAMLEARSGPLERENDAHRTDEASDPILKHAADRPSRRGKKSGLARRVQPYADS